MIAEFIKKIVDPMPEHMSKQGFEPNFYIRFLRAVARILIAVLRLHGRGRFSNEFIQFLDPRCTITLPKGGALVFRTGHGRLLWRARSLLTEEPMTIRWIDGFDPNDIFYDVGANVGNYSLYASKRGIRTVSFEPELFNAQLMYENFHLNGLLESCIIIPLAIGEKTKRDIFYLKSVSRGDALHSVGRPSHMLSDPSTVEKAAVLVLSLDDAINLFDLPKPTRLKIDVDRNELNVLSGARKTLSHVREICIELDLREDEHLRAKDLLEQAGFVLVSQEGLVRQWNTDAGNFLFRRAAPGMKEAST